jgi:hypothetical protein
MTLETTMKPQAFQSFLLPTVALANGTASTVPESYFTHDMSLFQSELSNLVGSGGGDTAEDIAGAFITLRWGKGV